MQLSTGALPQARRVRPGLELPLLPKCWLHRWHVLPLYMRPGHLPTGDRRVV